MRTTDPGPSDETGQRARCAAVELSRDAAREVGETTRFRRELHRGRHRYRVLRAADGGVHQQTSDAQLHANGAVTGSAHARIYDDRDLRLVEDHAQAVWVAKTEPAPDR